MNEESLALKEEYLSWSSVKPLFVNAYRESFTEKELNEYANLLKNPVFLSILKKKQVVGEKIDVLIRDRVSLYSDKNAEIADKALEKLENYISEQELLEK